MRGSVYKTANGYGFRIDYGRDKRGKRKQKRYSGYNTKKLAEKAMSNTLNDVNEGTYVPPQNITFVDFLQNWVNGRQNSLSKGTAKTYHYLVDMHVSEFFHTIKLTDLEVEDFDDFYNHLLNEKKLSPATIRKIHHSICKAGLNEAIRKKLLKDNPSTLADLPSFEKTRIEIWDEQETQEFLKKAKKHYLYIAFHLALSTGMRQGEILALQWNQIDMERKTISIDKSLRRNMEISTTKTDAGARLVSIPDQTVNELQRHWKWQKEQQLKLGKAYENKNLVVSTKWGTLISHRNLLRAYYQIRKPLNVKPITFHELRHTHATHLLKLGFHPKIVQERLGHNSIQVTIDTYSHLMPGLQETAAQKLGNMIFDPPDISNHTSAR
ncbi:MULTISPECIES: tyrosine-type recombinase/integrase [Bacillaceae]|uniref:Site-specific integrase n=2 Tax=Bacillaceae TaxID=186817 RepID=A0A345C0U5_9BACI|nr:tyrosine-type recombinase/integrase [Salicibibacter kimchii]AXF56826.1 site-specific integrase [Salicibibacter kimchii]